MNTASPRRIERVRHETRRRDLVVKTAERVGANFMRLTLTGPELEGFISLAYDDHIKVFVDTGAEEPVKNDFTPRHYDPVAQELVLEFFLHAGGITSDLAASATPGTPINIGGPRGSMIVPMDYDWHLLIGDETAIPAIARRLEELPAGTQVIALIQTGDAADQRAFTTAANADIRWLSRSDDLASATRALSLPAGEGFVWCGTEGSDMERVRDVLLHEKGHSLDHMRASAYWRR